MPRGVDMYSFICLKLCTNLYICASAYSSTYYYYYTTNDAKQRLPINKSREVGGAGDYRPMRTLYTDVAIVVVQQEAQAEWL